MKTHRVYRNTNTALKDSLHATIIVVVVAGLVGNFALGMNFQQNYLPLILIGGGAFVGSYIDGYYAFGNKSKNTIIGGAVITVTIVLFLFIASQPINPLLLLVVFGVAAWERKIGKGAF